MHISTIIPSQRTTRKIPGTPGYLYEEHRRELEEESAISPDVIAERGYQSVARPTNTNQEPRLMLQRLGFPSWAIREDYYFPGLWLPSYSPRGDLLPGQWKPRTPVANRDGKRMKYASARSAVRLDVHPRWSADRGQDDPTKVPAIQDPDIPLWITEGIKKGDSLTSRGICTVALSGVYNWRNTHATLGDWEDVRLKGREVTICFDADAITKPAVLRAMERLGKWLRSKGVAKVWYLVVPAEVNGHGVKGVDDYFAAGGTVKALEQAAMDRPPRVPDTSDAFTDARLAETLAEEVLDGAYVWAAGLDWLQWDGRKWQECHEVTVIESVRTWALARFAEAASDLQRDREGAAARVDGWRAMLGASRQRAVLNLARGIVERKADEFDADPYLLNTPGGVVDLRTGDILPHDPDLMCTKITSGSYIPGYTHPDWQTALQALPEEVAEWYQVRVGQALTGQTTPDGVLPILQGGGENGKSLLMTDGVLPAIGGYGSVASPKLFMSTKNEHSTERAELRGQRLVVAEELAEGRSIDVTALKQIMDVGRIKARRTHKDNMEFDASHSLFATTNYIPVVSETDHGTWRRLALVRFPFTYVKKDVPITDPDIQRRGDPTLKNRVKNNTEGQHDAIVTWAVEGARRFFANREELERDPEAADIMNLPARVAADTLEWRKDADRILAYWTECLVADPRAAAYAPDLLDHFNEWMTANGHNPWPKETFSTRFAGHAMTTSARVKRARTRDHSAIVRRPVATTWVGPGALKTLPKQADVWVGVRYRTDGDSA